MTEIIEDRARTNGLWPLEERCRRCDSQLRVNLSDLSYDGWKVGGYSFAGTEEIEHCFTFPCPACGHEFNKVSEAVIPVGIQDDLRADYRRRKSESPSII